MRAVKEQTFVPENEFPPVVRIPSPPADPPPLRRTIRPDRSPTVSANRCGAVRRPLADTDGDRNSEGEDHGESLPTSEDPIIWPEPSPLADWWDRVLGRESTP
jgi:hypothetical protein